MSRPAWALGSAGLIGLAALIQLALGAAAIAGADGLEANVREIESNADFGSLYLSLGGWGALTAALAVAEALVAASLWRGSPHSRLAGLIVAYLGLAGAFFGLAIFRWPSLGVVLLLGSAIFVLSYRSDQPLT